MSSAASRAALADIHDSLFVPADDDRQWDEQVYDEADDQDILGWDSNIEPVCFTLTSVGLTWSQINSRHREHTMKVVRNL